MTTAAAKDETTRTHLAGDYLVRHDAVESEDEGRPWVVLDGDLAFHDCYEDFESAVEEAERLALEAKDERMQATRDAICDLLPDCEDEDLLDRIKALLEGA